VIGLRVRLRRLDGIACGESFFQGFVELLIDPLLVVVSGWFWRHTVVMKSACEGMKKMGQPKLPR